MRSLRLRLLLAPPLTALVLVGCGPRGPSIPRDPELRLGRSCGCRRYRQGRRARDAQEIRPSAKEAHPTVPDALAQGVRLRATTSVFPNAHGTTGRMRRTE